MWCKSLRIEKYISFRMKWFFWPPFLSVSPFLLLNLARRQSYAYAIGLYTRPEMKSWPDIKFCAHAHCVLPRCCRRQAFFWCVFRSCFVKRCRNNAAARTAAPRLNKKTVGEVPRSFFLSAPSTCFFSFHLGSSIVWRWLEARQAGPYLSGKEWFIVGF